MNDVTTCAPSLSALWRVCLLAGGTVLLTTSCMTGPGYGPDGNVFVPGNSPERYGYGSPEQQQQQQAAEAARRRESSSSSSSSSSTTRRKTPDIKRDPSNTVVDMTPPERKTEKTETADTTSSPPEKKEETPPVESKPAAPREDLPFGQPVVGKKGYVYSPYAPDKGQVDVTDIPAGTKVKCPYTEKVFRVP